MEDFINENIGGIRKKIIFTRTRKQNCCRRRCSIRSRISCACRSRISFFIMSCLSFSSWNSCKEIEYTHTKKKKSQWEESKGWKTYKVVRNKGRLCKNFIPKEYASALLHLHSQWVLIKDSLVHAWIQHAESLDREAKILLSGAELARLFPLQTIHVRNMSLQTLKISKKQLMKKGGGRREKEKNKVRKFTLLCSSFLSCSWRVTASSSNCWICSVNNVILSSLEVGIGFRCELERIPSINSWLASSIKFSTRAVTISASVSRSFIFLVCKFRRREIFLSFSSLSNLQSCSFVATWTIWESSFRWRSALSRSILMLFFLSAGEVDTRKSINVDSSRHRGQNEFFKKKKKKED